MYLLYFKLKINLIDYYFFALNKRLSKDNYPFEILFFLSKYGQVAFNGFVDLTIMYIVAKVHIF